MARTVLILILVAATAGRGLAGETSSTERREVHPVRAGALGMATGTIGFVSGFYLGSHDDDGGEGLDAVARGVIIGSIVGALTLPLGAHAGNGSQGDLGLVMLASVLAGGVGWGLAAAADDGNAVIVTPVLQIVACVAVEVTTTPDGAPDGPEAAPDHRGWDLQAGLGAVDRQPALLIGGRF
ncbi:hypothetical protein GF314_09970 [bacterium]|nr:hypothetical protein [bacterium]